MSYISSAVAKVDIENNIIYEIFSRGNKVSDIPAEINWQEKKMNNSNSLNWGIVRLGSVGDIVNDLTILNGVVFAGLSSGDIYRSVDNGKSWEVVSSGKLDNCLVLISSEDTNTVYASSSDKAIKSSDGGQSWVDLEELFEGDKWA